MRALAITAVFFYWGTQLSTAAGTPADLLTEDGGVLCSSPVNLSEAIVAANRGDEKWVRSLDCVRTRAGVPVIKISVTPDMTQPWQVRVMPEGAPARTMWGFAPSFTLRNGKKIWPP